MPPLGEQAQKIMVDITARYDNTAIQKFKKDMDEFRAMRISSARLTPEQKTEEAKNKEILRRHNAQVADMNKNRAKQERNILFSGLGVMFFMMALNNALMNLVSPAADLVGIFEIFELILALFFLPVMLKLLPIMVSFLRTVSELPTGLKEIIGLLVLVGIGFTAIIGTLAQLQIFLGSLGLVGAATSVGALIAGILALAVPILLIVGALAALSMAFETVRKDIEAFFLGIQLKVDEILTGFGIAAPGSAQTRAALQTEAFNPLNAIPFLAFARSIGGIGEAGGALASGASPGQALNIYIQNMAGVQTTVTPDIGQQGAGSGLNLTLPS